MLLAIAVLAAFSAVDVDGRPDDVMIEFNGYRPGSPLVRSVEAVMAVVIGGAGVFLLSSSTPKAQGVFERWRQSARSGGRT